MYLLLHQLVRAPTEVLKPLLGKVNIMPMETGPIATIALVCPKGKAGINDGHPLKENSDPVMSQWCAACEDGVRSTMCFDATKGFWRNMKGEMPPVVHQYDRSDEMDAAVTRTFEQLQTRVGERRWAGRNTMKDAMDLEREVYHKNQTTSARKRRSASWADAGAGQMREAVQRY